MRVRNTIVNIISTYLREQGVDPRTDSLLIVGSEEDDLELAREVGFVNITQSNLEGFKGVLAIDAENINLPDDSYDVVLTHAVLHHCQSPHKAVLECIRISRKCFMFLEGNDSLLMRMAVRFHLHDPIEFPAVVDSGFTSGGVRNSAVPNHIYRWSERDLMKTVFTGFPERKMDVTVKSFFDFYAIPEDFTLRTTTKLAFLGRFPSLLRFLRFMQGICNALPIIGSQGNHFFAGIRKGQLNPWIEETPNGRRLKREFEATRGGY